MNFNQLNEPKSRDSSQEFSKNKERYLVKRNEDDIQYYEYGAHFPYQTVYLKLEKYLSSITNLKTSENDGKKKLSNNIFNISIYDKSRNINLNNNIRQNNIHLNNQKKGITLLLFNKSNVTMQNINPIINNNDKNNLKDIKNNNSRRKGAINHHHPDQRNSNNSKPKAKIKNIIHQKEVFGKKSEREAYSTSHPKKNMLNNNNNKEETVTSKGKNSKSNPVPYKRNINTNRAHAFINIQINSNNNFKNAKTLKERNISKKQPNITTKRNTHNNSNQYSVSSKEKDKKLKPHSANAKIKSNHPSTRTNHNIIILSLAKNQFIEPKPISIQKKNGIKREDKSRNTENQNSNEKSLEKNKEKNKENTKQLMTFNSIEQNKDKHKDNPNNQKEETIIKKPHSSDKPVVIPQMKDVKFINIISKNHHEQYYPLSRKHHAEVKINLTSNQNSPSVSQGKMTQHNKTNIIVDLSTKKVNSTSKYSSRNFSSTKQPIKSTTAKPVLSTKRFTNDKDKLIKKLIISNQETSNSEMKMSPIITASNQSSAGNQQINSNKAIGDLNSKNRIKNNSIASKEGKVHVKSMTSKQSFIQCSHNNNGGIKKNQYTTTKKQK